MDRLFSRLEPTGLLSQVREGMAVYDREEKRVGKVKEVHFGEGTALDREAGIAPVTPGQVPERPHSILEGLGAALGARDDLPVGARDHLMRVGYVAIDATGLFAGDHFATSEQIAGVDGDRVRLTIPGDELICG